MVFQNHSFGTYGIIPLSSTPPSPNQSRHSSRSSSSHSASSSAIPQDSLTAPIQALQTLANAADQAAASREIETGEEVSERNKKRKRATMDGNRIHLRVRKKTKPDPTPRNSFPDVVTKGLVTEKEARELWDM